MASSSRGVRLVQSGLKDSHLLHAQRPPCSKLDLLLYGRHWGLSWWRLVQLPPLRDRAASDQGPGHLAVLRGRRCTAAPNESERTNTACTATSVALGTLLTCQPGMALYGMVMWRC